MNRSILGVMKMYLTDVRPSIYIFWSILFAVYALMLLILFQFEDGQVSSGGLSPLYVYMLIVGIVSLKETLPYALGMGVRRKDYYWGVVGSGIGLAGAFSFIMAVLSRIETVAFRNMERQFQFFRIPFFDSIGFGEEWGSQFLFLSFAFSFGLLLSLLHRRFGKISLYAFFGMLFLAIILLHLFHAWPSIFVWLVSLDSIVAFSLWLLPVIFANAAASYLLVRRVTV